MMFANASTEPLGGAEAWVLIVIAVIGLLGVVIPSVFAYKASVHARTAATQATQVNEAVNGNSPGELRLYDLAHGTKAVVDVYHVLNLQLHQTIADALSRHDHALNTIDHIEALAHPREYREVLMARPYWPGHHDRRDASTTEETK